jgi:hypothetical protein
MSLTLTTADAALKEDYQPAIREQLSEAFMLLSQVEKNTTDIEGRRAVLSLHVSRNSGVGARSDGGTLPAAGEQGYAEERVPVKYLYGRIKVSGPVIAAMKSDQGSFTRAVDSESKGVVKDLKRDVNRQLFGTTDGVIATAGTTTATTVVQLLAATTLVQMRQFEINMRVDIGTVAAPTTIASDRKITAINRTNKTITIDGAAVTTVSGTHFVFRQGAGGTGIELTGLRSIVSATGTLFNVNPATQPTWVSYVNTVGGTPNDLMFETAMDEIYSECGDTPNLLVSTAGISRGYSASLTSQKRFTNTMEMKGGFKALSIATPLGELAFTWDRDCPLTNVFILNTKNLINFEMADWEFMDRDGSVLSRVSGEDAYEAVLYSYRELATDQRSAHGLISSVTES